MKIFKITAIIAMLFGFGYASYYAWISTDYLKPQVHTWRYQNTCFGCDQNESKPDRYYDATITPTDRNTAVNTNCTVKASAQEITDCPYYAAAIEVIRNDQKYLTFLAWQSGTGYDPELEIINKGYIVKTIQYFVYSTQRPSLYPPTYNDPLSDISDMMNSWLSAAYARDGIQVAP